MAMAKQFAPNIRSDFARRDVATAVIAILGWLCYVLAAVLMSCAIGLLIHNDLLARSHANSVSAAAQAWPPADKRKAWDLAQQYNEQISARLGGSIPGDISYDDGESLENKDFQYMQALNVDGSGAMASLRIPKISVNIPIYHTTLSHVLDEGAGHVYGSALPIGENGTSSAIAAHSGGVQGMLFTRLHELKPGDTFSINVLTDEQTYRVVSREVVNPKHLESALQRIRDGNTKHHALVTLITCTPIGINSDRLLVTAERVPDAAPDFASQHDVLLLSIVAAVLLFAVLMAIAVIAKRRKGAYALHHRAA